MELNTVPCPICGDIVEIPDYDRVTKTDALVAHIALKHGSGIRPATPDEGPPLPRSLHIKWPWRPERRGK